MTDTRLRSTISRAVEIDRQIADLTAELKTLKEQIATEAETRPDEAVPTEGGGASITFEGDDGCIARVTQAGATLKSTLKPSDKKFARIKEAAGGDFTRLFETEVVHRPVADFRKFAAELLGTIKARTLVKLCETAGKITVSFETKDAEKAA
ncbi:MAG: hypothetical protein HZA93_24080 [Verrucomicrobia bacterium]|nr:hypothetical protein [Verrucomicrobiota bacterium]